MSMPRGRSCTASSSSKLKGPYKYEAPWPIYSMNWSMRPDRRFRLALGSFYEEHSNKFQIISLDEERDEFSAKSTFYHPYLTTKIMWIPDSKGVYPDLLATSGNNLRIWRAGEPYTFFECSLYNIRCPSSSPLTSFDWNEVDPNLIGTSDDTTCTIWALETGQALRRARPVSGRVMVQLDAHHREVFDIGFSRLGNGRDIFATVGNEGFVRLFDMRTLNNGVTLYKEAQQMPLLRLAWNKHNPYYMATVGMDSSEVIVIDVRMIFRPCIRLEHSACVNDIAWGPNSSSLCTAGEDHQAVMWNIHDMQNVVKRSIVPDTESKAEFNQIEWGAKQPDWIALCHNRDAEILRI